MVRCFRFDDAGCEESSEMGWDVSDVASERGSGVRVDKPYAKLVLRLSTCSEGSLPLSYSTDRAMAWVMSARASR